MGRDDALRSSTPPLPFFFGGWVDVFVFLARVFFPDVIRLRRTRAARRAGEGRMDEERTSEALRFLRVVVSVVVEP